MSINAAVIVLCGGAGRRLGGVDKPLLEIQGIPIIAQIQQNLAALGPVHISANRNRELYQRYGQVTADDLQSFQGPLAGIAASIGACQPGYVFICPGDCPGVSVALARRLLTTLVSADGESEDFQVACAHDGERLQYLHLALHTDMLSNLEDYLQAGGRSVRGWLAQINVIAVDCQDLKAAFADIDTLPELYNRTP